MTQPSFTTQVQSSTKPSPLDLLTPHRNTPLVGEVEPGGKFLGRIVIEVFEKPAGTKNPGRDRIAFAATWDLPDTDAEALLDKAGAYLKLVGGAPT